MNDDIVNDVHLQRLAEGAHRLLHIDGPRYRRLWGYYRNPMRVAAIDADDANTQRPYRQAQEWGLPSRITGYRSATKLNEGTAIEGATRKEVVIENDIAWRVDTMVDSLFGKPLIVSSAAPDPARRAMLSELLRLVIAQNGGVAFLQQIALLGSVYGFVDILVKLDTTALSDVAEDVREGALDPSAKPPAAAGGFADGQRSDSQPDVSTCGTADLGQRAPFDTTKHNTPTADVTPSAPADDLTNAAAASSTAAGESSSAHVPLPPVTGPASDIADASQTIRGANHTVSPDALSRIARLIRLEIVEPTRALPVLLPTDVRTMEAYAQVYLAPRPQVAPQRQQFKARWIDRVKRSAVGLLGARDPLSSLPIATTSDQVTVIDVLTDRHWQRYEDGKLVKSGVNSLGTIPLVHVQNVAEPFAYEGAGDVEPLIPLQDELNIRLSDRANRITLQSFKMYLGKGIENFTDTPIAPGQMWATDNVDADVVQFGGDVASPSEEAHIAEVREALDKTSGVTPIAAGAIKGRIGRLTSAAALRITLQALLNRTEKKRTTYGAAIERLCELSLAWLDVAGVLKTSTDERRVELTWSSPIPQNESELLEQAQAKLRVGVPQAIVLRELGY